MAPHVEGAPGSVNVATGMGRRGRGCSGAGGVGGVVGGGEYRGTFFFSSPPMAPPPPLPACSRPAAGPRPAPSLPAPGTRGPPEKNGHGRRTGRAGSAGRVGSAGRRRDRVRSGAPRAALEDRPEGSFGAGHAGMERGGAGHAGMERGRGAWGVLSGAAGPGHPQETGRWGGPAGWRGPGHPQGQRAGGSPAGAARALGLPLTTPPHPPPSWRQRLRPGLRAPSPGGVIRGLLSPPRPASLEGHPRCAPAQLRVPAVSQGGGGDRGGPVLGPSQRQRVGGRREMGDCLEVEGTREGQRVPLPAGPCNSERRPAAPRTATAGS